MTNNKVSYGSTLSFSMNNREVLTRTKKKFESKKMNMKGRVV